MLTPTPAEQQRQNLWGLTLVALAGLVWGTIPLVTRAADGASAIKVFYRVLFAGLGLLGFMAATGRLGEVGRLPRRKIVQIAGQGAILALNWVLFLGALDRTTVAVAELLGYTGPVFVAALAPFVTRERFDRRVVLPLLLSLGGIVVILAPQGLGVHSPREILGAAMAFASALTYATLLLRSKKILHGVPGSAFMLLEFGVATVILAPVAAVLYAGGHGPTTPRAYAALLTLGLVQTAFAGVLFIEGLRRTRTDHAAILTYAEPVSAVVFAAMFLGEALSVLTVVGGAMVVAGGLVVARLRPAPRIEAVPLEAAGVEPPDTLASSADGRDGSGI